MRKLKFFNVFVGMCIMCLSVFTASCSSDSNDDENNGNAEEEYSIVGTWRHDFSSGYCEITFKKDGTGYGEENDEGNGYAPEHFSYTFEYTYRNDKVTIIYDDDDEIETGQIIWVNKNKFIADIADENSTWVRQ